MTTRHANDKISTKLCIACSLSSELRMHLKASEAWMQSQISPKGDAQLHELRFQNQEYIGVTLERSSISTTELDEVCDKLVAHLRHYCPNLPPHSIRVQIFPQVFIS